MINGSSRRDLLLNSQNFCRSMPAGAENPSLSRLCYRKLWGSRNRRSNYFRSNRKKSNDWSGRFRVYLESRSFGSTLPSFAEGATSFFTLNWSKYAEFLKKAASK
ncbi:photosystem i p700 chlorophyll a apoprotein a1 [Phtheirospermum japonicum]|uniref:Photosystem i p700 chlorophyll a apoprotein a1 n=1 Tax=Phtheirospermum japonicum TaxID=374723 RepID=A0A830D346_9LAMI|nr:photosystem i p700 chlorophyll a apoprotein a1 [Phtheirospermum japonicum]